MNRNILTSLTVALSLLAGSVAFAQNTPNAAAGQHGQKQQKLVKVATLPTAEINSEFQRNVQLVRAQLQALIEMNTAYEKETNPVKKAEMKKSLDENMAKLNENNDRMAKAYGFSLTRNYTMEIVSSNIYTYVTDEEAAAIEKAEKEQAAKAQQPAAKAPADKKKK